MSKVLHWLLCGSLTTQLKPNATFMLCIQNVSTKVLLCTQNARLLHHKHFIKSLPSHPMRMVEQKSCFSPKTFEQKSSLASKNLNKSLHSHPTCLNKSLALNFHPKYLNKSLKLALHQKCLNKSTSLASHTKSCLAPQFSKKLLLHTKRFEQKECFASMTKIF